MIRRVGLSVIAAALVVWVASTSAQQVVTGTVVRIDPTAGVVVLDNGQMVQMVPNSVILVNNQPVQLGTLLPGTAVVVQSGQPVMYQDGRYVVMVPPVPMTTAKAYDVVPRTAAGVYEVSGNVLRADPVDHVIVFDDGRNVWLDTDTRVFVNEQPAQISTLNAGTPVTVRSTRPIATRDQQYVTMREVASGTVVRVDPPATVVLSDGRTIQLTGDQLIYVGNQAVAISSIQPGSRVVIYAPGAISPSASAMLGDSGVRQRENERQGP